MQNRVGMSSRAVQTQSCARTQTAATECVWETGVVLRVPRHGSEPCYQPHGTRGRDSFCEVQVGRNHSSQLESPVTGSQGFFPEQVKEKALPSQQPLSSYPDLPPSGHWRQMQLLPLTICSPNHLTDSALCQAHITERAGTPLLWHSPVPWPQTLLPESGTSLR